MQKIKFIVVILGILASHSTYAQDSLTIGEVFDYDVGDVFELKTFEPVNSFLYQRITIQGKTYSNTGDTVSYSGIEELYMGERINGVWNNRHDSRSYSETYHHLDSSIFFYIDLVNYDSLKNRNGALFLDTTFDYTELCNLPQNGLSYHYADANGSKQAGIHFGKGIGLTFSWNLSSIPPKDERTLLIFYKKGVDSCGTRNLIVGTDEIDNSDKISLYPNPTSERIYLNGLEMADKYRYNIYNINGTLIKNDEYNDYIEVDDLDRGVYLLLLNSDNKSIRLRFVRD